MPISYKKLFALMKEKGLSTYRIRKDKIISESTLQYLREGKPVSTESIAALCEALDCQPGDIMEYIPEETKETPAPLAQEGQELPQEETIQADGQGLDGSKETE